MKFRWNSVLWLCAYLSMYPICLVHSAASASTLATGEAVTSASPAAGGGGDVPYIEIPEGYPLPYVVVDSLEFKDRGYNSDSFYTDRMDSSRVNKWHGATQKVIKTMYDFIAGKGGSGLAPNIACARVSLILKNAADAVTPFVVRHHEAGALPSAGAGAVRMKQRMLFLSGLGWGRWDSSDVHAIKEHCKTLNLTPVTLSDFLKVTAPVDGKTAFVDGLGPLAPYRAMLLQFRDFFDSKTVWSRLPMLRIMPEEIAHMDRRIHWVDRKDYETPLRILTKKYDAARQKALDEYKLALAKAKGDRETLLSAERKYGFDMHTIENAYQPPLAKAREDAAIGFEDARERLEEAKEPLGCNFYDSEQGIFRYVLDGIKSGRIMRDLLDGVPIGATLHRVVLDIASHRIACRFCGCTYFWEAESRNLITEAIIETLSMHRPDIIIDPLSKRLFVEFSGRGVESSGSVRLAELEVNSIWPYMAVKNIEDKPPTAASGAARR